MNPYTVPALVIGGGIIALAVLVTTVRAILAERIRDGDPYEPRHNHRARHTHRLPVAGGQLKLEPESPVAPMLIGQPGPDDDWWDQAAPDSWRGPRWHPAPGNAAAAGAPDDPGGPCPDCQHWVCGCDPHIDTTGVQPHAVLTWGMSAPEKAAELAAEYMP